MATPDRHTRSGGYASYVLSEWSRWSSIYLCLVSLIVSPALCAAAVGPGERNHGATTLFGRDVFGNGGLDGKSPPRRTGRKMLALALALPYLSPDLVDAELFLGEEGGRYLLQASDEAVHDTSAGISQAGPVHTAVTSAGGIVLHGHRGKVPPESTTNGSVAEPSSEPGSESAPNSEPGPQNQSNETTSSQQSSASPSASDSVAASSYGVGQNVVPRPGPRSNASEWPRGGSESAPASSYHLESNVGSSIESAPSSNGGVAEGGSVSEPSSSTQGNSQIASDSEPSLGSEDLSSSSEESGALGSEDLSSGSEESGAESGSGSMRAPTSAMPPSSSSPAFRYEQFLKVFKRDKNFSNLNTANEVAMSQSSSSNPIGLDYIATLQNVTFLAPVNDAWTNLEPAVLTCLVKGDLLFDVVVRSHTVKGRITLDSLTDGLIVQNLFQTPLEVSRSQDARVTINSVDVIKGDAYLFADKVIHSFARIMLPSNWIDFCSTYDENPVLSESISSSSESPHSVHTSSPPPPPPPSSSSSSSTSISESNPSSSSAPIAISSSSSSAQDDQQQQAHEFIRAVNNDTGLENLSHANHQAPTATSSSSSSSSSEEKRSPLDMISLLSNITFLAPLDEAWKLLNPNITDCLSAGHFLLDVVIKSQTLKGKWVASALTAGQIVYNLLGDPLEISEISSSGSGSGGGGGFFRKFVNGLEIVRRDMYEAEDKVIQGLSGFFLPREWQQYCTPTNSLDDASSAAVSSSSSNPEMISVSCSSSSTPLTGSSSSPPSDGSFPCVVTPHPAASSSPPSSSHASTASPSSAPQSSEGPFRPSVIHGPSKSSTALPSISPSSSAPPSKNSSQQQQMPPKSKASPSSSPSSPSSPACDEEHRGRGSGCDDSSAGGKVGNATDGNSDVKGTSSDSNSTTGGSSNPEDDSNPSGDGGEDSTQGNRGGSSSVSFNISSQDSEFQKLVMVLWWSAMALFFSFAILRPGIIME